MLKYLSQQFQYLLQLSTSSWRYMTAFQVVHKMIPTQPHFGIAILFAKSGCCRIFEVILAGILKRSNELYILPALIKYL